MKTQNYITAAIENMFDTNNDQQIMTAFLFRKVLDWTPRQVGKHLKLSQVQVNLLVQAMHYKMGLDDDKNMIFKQKQKLIYASVCKFCTVNMTKNFIATTGETRDRLKTYHQSIMN